MNDEARIVIRITAEEKRRYEQLAKSKGSRSAASRLLAYARAELLIEDGMLGVPPFRFLPVTKSIRKDMDIEDHWPPVPD